jgi:Rha family phage regulatory protein
MMTHDDMPPAGGDSNPVVFIQNGQVRATSRDVSGYFGKRHADVVRAIRGLIELEPGLSQRTFALAEYIDEQGKPRIAYDMDRDGFTLLAMGFTGPQALHFKWAYIQAFNRMEAKLDGQHAREKAEHKSFPDWPVDEIRAMTAVVEMYRRAYGPLSAQWSAAIVGFPTPPADMIEIGRQLLLDLRGGEKGRESGEAKAA